MGVADLLVIGAGPAGTAAAVTAAASGRHVVLVDAATFPRDKTCGDGLTTEALRRLDALGVPLPALDASGPVTEVVVTTPSGRRITMRLPSGERARVMTRLDLDAALVEHARDTGADVRTGRRLVGLRAGADGVEATLDDGATLRAPFVVAADGNYSTARRLLAPDDPPATGDWYAFRQYFSGVDDTRLWVLFERDLLPGYAWVFPLPGGRANVGFGMLRGPGVTGKVMARRWRDLLARPALRDVLGPVAAPQATHRAWPIPSRLDLDRLTIGRVLFAGDAAGVVDPMTGEGIAQALETGVLAARSLLPDDGPDAVADRYRRAVDEALGADLRFAAALQRLLRRPGGARAAVRVAGLTRWTRRSFARWLWEDYPRALVLTPRRWHRGAMHAPGAYA
jgi:geranylgeranyl reductase family protein